MSFLASIAGGIFKSLLSYIDMWWQRKQQEADKWNAAVAGARVLAIQEQSAVEKELLVLASKTSPLKTASPSAWLKASALLLLLCLGACFRKDPVPVTTWPVIPLPERPVLPAGPATWTEREAALVGVIEQLEALIAKYNAAASAHNSPP